MPSGKRAKQQRRQAAQAPPPVRSKGAARVRGSRQASPRVLAAAGGILVLIVIGVVLAIVLSKGSNGTNASADGRTIGIVPGTPEVGNSAGPEALQGAPDVAKLFKGIPQTGFVLGKPTAPVELTEFIDLQCPVCQDFETTMLPTLVQKYVRTGKLRIKMQPWAIRDFPGGPQDSHRGQSATIAAAAQNKAFDFAEVLYDNQGTEGTGWLNDGMMSAIAASVDGLKPFQLATDANSSSTAKIVQQIDAAATAGGYNATPTILLAKGIATPRVVASGLPNLQQLESQIDALLK